jgi:hypothetical protein
LASDFFTVETLFFQMIYLLMFFEIGRRRVHCAGCTAHSDGAWVPQQARHLMWKLTDREPMIPTHVRAPNADAFMERWIRLVREECLDKLLIINQTHLRCVMREYVVFFNTARPHQGLEQQIPVPKASSQSHGPVLCRNVLGGIIHNHYRDAA